MHPYLNGEVGPQPLQEVDTARSDLRGHVEDRLGDGHRVVVGLKVNIKMNRGIIELDVIM